MTTTSATPSATTTIASAPATRVADRPLRLTLPRVVRAELRKLVTSRSTYLTLLFVPVGLVGFGLLAAGNATGPVDAATLLGGTSFLVVVTAAFGAVVGAREFGSGLVRTTLAAVPRRGTLVLAKVLALVAVVLPTAVLGVVVALVAGGAPAGGGARAGSTLAVASGTVAYFVAVSLVGLGVGILLRSTAGAVAAVIGGLLVLPMVAVLALPADWSDLARYLPSAAGDALSAAGQGGGLSAGGAGATLAAWVVASLAAATWTLGHRDA